VNNCPNYQSPKNIASPQNRLGENAQFIINCPWYAQKVNYPLLILLKKIAQSSNISVLFRFFSGGALVRKNDFIPFVKDIEQILGSDHVHVYPYMPYSEYMAIMEEGDICLDSHHFGGFNVIIDGLYLQKPSVVMEGKRWYNRAGARLMKNLGLAELVAKSPSEYTQLTLKLINNQDYYQTMRERITQLDLQNEVFQSSNGQTFKKAIDFLIQNHYQIQSDTSKKPIRIF
jgi:predicted O-linked N-acetylglucosamine transferase (SPINDLY family)